MEKNYDVPISRVNIHEEVNYIVHREKSVMVFKHIENRANFLPKL